MSPRSSVPLPRQQIFMPGLAAHEDPGLPAHEEPALAQDPFDSRDLPAVEAEMARLCQQLPGRLGDILWEHIASGGKRLRARLALGCVEVLGGKRRQAVPWAAACELLHNATLIHDDLQDGDRIRRGRPATWARHGAAQAINAGDLGLMLPYRALARLQLCAEKCWLLASSLAEHAEQVVRGQSAEQLLLRARHLAWHDYAAAVEGKTAALFSLPVEGAALIVGQAPAEARRLAHGFRPIGLVFQLQDDILDLFGDKGRLEAGADLREGKVSALVVEHLDRFPEDRDWLLALLGKTRADTSAEEIDDARRRFARHALRAVWTRIEAIEAELDHSEALGGHLPLQRLARGLVSRALRPINHTREPRSLSSSSDYGRSA